MPDNNTNKNRDLKDFLRYERGEMTGKEKNAFERELQKDSFSEEAMEGLVSLSPEEAAKDFATLQKRLNSRTKKNPKFIVYRIAASVAVLMIISSVFLIVERNKTGRQLSETAVNSRMMEIPESYPVRVPDLKEQASESKALRKMEDSGKPTGKKTAKTYDNAKSPVGGVKTETAQTVERVAENKIKVAEENVAAEKAAMPLAVMTSEKSGVNKDAKLMQAKSDSQLIANIDSSVSGLDEVVLVGYGRAKNEAGRKDTLAGYSPPQPVVGKNAFDKYILENLHYPDSTTSGQRVVVVLSFVVQTNGNIDSIRIVRSPGIPFSQEAIRLIKSGPLWKPAMDKGKVIEDKVTVRIVFK